MSNTASSSSHTLTIDNNTYTIDADSNSIIVISPGVSVESKPDFNTSNTQNLNKPEVNSISTSTHLNESNGYLKQIETELAKTKQKLEEVQQENVLIKEYNTHLARKLERKHTNSGTKQEDDDDTDSIVAYVDVQNIANKLEYYLIETNKLFKTNNDCVDSVKFLIKNIWSLTAHEYAEANLDEFKKVRDELTDKLDKFNSSQQQQNLHTMNTSTTATTNYELISSNELEIITNDTNSLKEKLVKQNELLKLLKQHIENSKLERSFHHSKQISVVQTQTEEEQVNEDEDNDDDDEDITPGSSPTSFVTNFSKFVLRKRPDKKRQKETLNSQETGINTEHNKGKSYYLHNFKDFVAVQVDSIDTTLIQDEPQTTTIISSDIPEQQPTALTTQNNQSVESANNLFTCPHCQIAYDSNLFETSEIFIQKFEKHTSCCELNTKKTCIITLSSSPIQLPQPSTPIRIVRGARGATLGAALNDISNDITSEPLDLNQVINSNVLTEINANQRRLDAIEFRIQQRINNISKEDIRKECELMRQEKGIKRVRSSKKEDNETED